LTVGYVAFRGADWQGSGHLHTVMEAVATLLALIIGFIALVRYYSKKNNAILFIGAGFLGTAFLDGYHAIVTSAVFAPYLPSELHSLIPWSWVASRLFLSVLLCLSWLAWSRDENSTEVSRGREMLIYSTIAVLTIATFVFFAFVPLPAAYYPELMFHRPEEFLPAIFFFVALCGHLKKGAWRHDPFEHWLVLALVVGLVSQTVFMSFSGRLFDMEFDLAHLLKKVSYFCVLIGLLISMYGLFRRAEEGTQMLAQANGELHGEIERRERMEANLARRAKELARSNAELEEFAFVASHDLQEPLRKVQAFGDRLQTKFADALGDEGRDYIARMQAASSRMQTLIQNLLTFSRVSSKGQPFEPVNLNEVADEMISDFEVRIDETSAKIEVSELPTIDADPMQMRQLFQNLIGNALKYRREDVPPHIRISAVIQASGSHDLGSSAAEACRIVVTDNGIGFDEQYVDRIFGIFQRLHGRTEYEGTGVGLAICRKIAERHGGTITAQSREGEGSTFIVTILTRHGENS
jgi:signal transduction histidine kinase